MTSSAKHFRIVTDKDVADMRGNGQKRDRHFMDVIVHIPVAVAIGFSIYGYQQYGWFLVGLAPLTIYLSVTLSRSLERIIETRRLRPDVMWASAISALACFCAEAYGVHLGLERFNHMNAAEGLMVIDDAALIAFSVMLGLKNFYNRRAFVTGLDSVTAVEWSIEIGRNKSSLRKKEDEAKNTNWNSNLVGSERRDRFGKMDAASLRGRHKNQPTMEHLETAVEIAEKRGDKDSARILRQMIGDRQPNTQEAKRA